MKIGKILGYILLTLVIVAAVAIPATVGIHPFIGPRKRAATDRAYERTPLRLERGHIWSATYLPACSVTRPMTGPNMTLPLLPEWPARVQYFLWRACPEHSPRRISHLMRKPGWADGATTKLAAPFEKASIAMETLCSR